MSLKVISSLGLCIQSDECILTTDAYFLFSKVSFHLSPLHKQGICQTKTKGLL